MTNELYIDNCIKMHNTPVGDVGVLTPTLFPVRGFNTRTFSAVFPQFCTNALQQSLLRFSGRSVSTLAAAASSPLPLKHDTGFECDRLMIGCSALSPASLGVLDLSVSSCWGGGNLCYGYLHLPFPGTWMSVFSQQSFDLFSVCSECVFILF